MRANIAGHYTPPFRPHTTDEEAQLARQVAALKPDLFWVGLSTPKQEQFMAKSLANPRRHAVLRRRRRVRFSRRADAPGPALEATLRIGMALPAPLRTAPIVETLPQPLIPLARRLPIDSPKRISDGVSLTPELSDAGSPVRPHWQLMWTA